MNGTIALNDIGLAYTSLFEGTDASSGINFGNCKTFPERSDEISGILISADGITITFPQPFTIEDSKVIGKTYEIELNSNWTVQKKNEKGDFEIVEKK